MHEYFGHLVDGVRLIGNPREDVPRFLSHHGFPNTAAHSAAVAAEARRIAVLAGIDEFQAETAGWLHDVSAVVPSAERARIAGLLGLSVLPEEDAFPMIVHQRLSVVMARDVFRVDCETVLDAIGCHTTLRASATPLDKVVFIADKLAWDQPGTPEYHDGLLDALERSLDDAVAFYLDYVWRRRQALKVIHPWLREAYEQFVGQ